MNSSSVVCKQCLLNISTIYLASRPISKYPYPNIWTRAEHLYSNVSLLLDQSNGNISFCRDLWKNISTFDPALINNETEYFHSFILFHSFDIELVNRKCRLSIHNNSSIKILLKNPINVFMKQFVELPQVALEMIFSKIHNTQLSMEPYLVWSKKKIFVFILPQIFEPKCGRKMNMNVFSITSGIQSTIYETHVRVCA